MPRIPHHAMAMADRRGGERVGRGCSDEAPRFQRPANAYPITHANRTTMTAAQTAAAVKRYAMSWGRSSRCRMGLSCRPTRMNASTFSTKTTTSHTAYDGMRTRAGYAGGASDEDGEDHHRDDPGEGSRSASIHTAKVERNCTMTDVDTSVHARGEEERHARQDGPEEDAAHGDDRERGQRAPAGEAASHRRGDRETVDEQRTRIVEEALALDDHQHTVRRAQLPEHRGRGGRVGRGHDRAERDGRGPGSWAPPSAPRRPLPPR